MTGTVAPPRPQRPATATAAVAAGGSWRDDRSLPATVALALLTVAVAVGFGRLFSNGEFLPPVVFAALAGHGVAWWCRRNDLPTGMAAVASLGAVGLVAAWTILGHTTAYGLPIPLTARTALEVLGGARQQFSTIKAPAPPLPGFVLATVLAIGITAFMADWAAFRLRATFEAMIPAFTLFLFTAALGTPRHRTWAVAVFIAAVLGFLVVQGLSRSNRAGAWFGGRAGTGPAALVRTAGVIGVVAILVGLVLGPRLPGPDAPLVKYKNRASGGPSSRATISPLVDIRGRIVEQRDIEVFTVKANEPSYWRLTSLDTFNGTIWSSNSTYRDVRGRIRSDEILQPSLDTVEIEQEFSITGLASIWLPAAFRPERASGVDVSYASDSSSLITPEDTTDGTTYTVRSAVPRMTPAILDGSPAVAPEDIRTQYLQLPELSARVVAEARRITQGASTPYQRALALQNHFRANYGYDINAGQGHDSRTIESFLFESKTGYCEQFAGTYAVLARAIGLPSRVAVGFTPGELDEDEGVYRVKGGHGHAWAEVYLHNYGWVQFDPTPGRGDPQAVTHTGLEPDQDETLAEAQPVPTETTLAPGADGATTATSAPVFEDLPDQTVTTDPQGDADLPAIAVFLLVVAGLGAAWAVAIPLLHARRRQRRRHRPGAAAKVLADWNDTAEVLASAGVSRRSSETMSEYARRAAASAGLQSEPAAALRRLAGDASFAAYAGDEVPEQLAARAAADADTVRIAVLEQVSTASRIGWWLDPRPLVAAGRNGSG